MRIIGKFVKDVNDTSASFKSLNFFHAGQLRDYQAAVFIFQCVHNLVPGVFRNNYRANRDIHEYDTRNSDKLAIELKSRIRSVKLNFSIKVSWNCSLEFSTSEHQGG